MNPFNSNYPIKFVPPQTPKTPSTKAPQTLQHLSQRRDNDYGHGDDDRDDRSNKAGTHCPTCDKMSELFLPRLLRHEEGEKFLIVHCAHWFLVAAI